MMNLPIDPVTGLRRYGVWVDLEVSPCDRCYWPLVVMYECPDKDLKVVTSKRMEARTWPNAEGLWFIGEEHTFKRCLEVK
jgi:hypothetical protein